MEDNIRFAGYLDGDNPQRKYYYCDCCGKPFWKPDGYRKRFCCTECQRKMHSIEYPRKPKKRKTVYKKICSWCNKPFETNQSKQKYCCKECGYEGNKRLHRMQWADAFIPKLLVCKECGNEFMTECGCSRSVFCCQSCADKYERRIEHSTLRHKEGQKEQKKRREQLIADKTLGSVTYDAIYKRDQGICQICGLPVHEDKLIDDNWGGTIDHIEPLSLGGYHSMNNCQLAHRICNSLKCQSTEEYRIDWSMKSEENNYWKNKFDNYKSLMTKPVG